MHLRLKCLPNQFVADDGKLRAEVLNSKVRLNDKSLSARQARRWSSTPSPTITRASPRATPATGSPAR